MTEKLTRYVQIGAIEARAPQSGQAKLFLVPVYKDMRDRNRAVTDKYFRRPEGKR